MQTFVNNAHRAIQTLETNLQSLQQCQDPAEAKRLVDNIQLNAGVLQYKLTEFLGLLPEAEPSELGLPPGRWYTALLLDHPLQKGARVAYLPPRYRGAPNLEDHLQEGRFDRVLSGSHWKVQLPTPTGPLPRVIELVDLYYYLPHPHEVHSFPELPQDVDLNAMVTRL